MPPPRLNGKAIEPRMPTPPVAAKSGDMAYPTPSLFWALGGFPSSTGVPVSPLTAIQVATVYGCIKARSEDLAKVPLRLRHREADGGYKPAETHPLAALLRRPNGYMTSFNFKRFMEMSVCYRGNAYVAIIRGKGGEPSSLIPIVPDKCYPEISSQGNLFYRLSHPMIRDGAQVKFDADNMLHIKNLSLDSGYVGMSPIAAAQETVGLALAAQQHGATLFRQGAQLSGVLKHPGVLTPEAKTFISRSFEDKFSGVQNAHKVPVLEEGMSYEKIAMTSEDAQLLETRGYQRTEICAIFRVPPHKIMDLANSTFHNLETAEQGYINDGLMPDAEQISQELHEKLLFEDEADDYVFDWNWDYLLRSARLPRYQAHAIGLNNGFLSVNDVRVEEGLSRIEGGDEYNKPLNIGTTGQSGVGPATGSPGDMGRNPVPADQGDGEDGDAPPKAKPKPKGKD